MIQSLIPSLYCFFLKISNHIFFKRNQTLLNFCFNFSLIKMVAGQERLYLDIISPARLGKYVWAWLVNEDDWVHKLGLCGFQFWACRLTGPVD